MQMQMLDFKDDNKENAFSDATLWLDLTKNVFLVHDCMDEPVLDFRIVQSLSDVSIVMGADKGCFLADAKDDLQSITDKCLKMHYINNEILNFISDLHDEFFDLGEVKIKLIKRYIRNYIDESVFVDLMLREFDASFFDENVCITFEIIKDKIDEFRANTIKQ